MVNKKTEFFCFEVLHSETSVLLWIGLFPNRSCWQLVRHETGGTMWILLEATPKKRYR